MNTYTQREIYPERMFFGKHPGKIEVERIRFPSGDVSTEIRAGLDGGAQYAIYLYSDSPLGKSLASIKPEAILVDLEDAAREILRASHDILPADALRLTCQHAVNKWEGWLRSDS